MTVSISGLTLTDTSGSTPNEHYARFVGTGTYTAADFTITASDGLGFTPTKVKTENLTDRVGFEYFVDSNLGTSNVEGLKTVAAGTRTYEDAGLTVTTKSLAVDVSKTIITDDDDFVIECWG